MEQRILDKLAEAGRESADRRGFLTKAGKAAVVIPAVALLLSAKATPAEAWERYGKRGGAKGKGKAKGKSKGKSRGKPESKRGRK